MIFTNMPCTVILSTEKIMVISSKELCSVVDVGFNFFSCQIKELFLNTVMCTNKYIIDNNKIIIENIYFKNLL